MLYAIFWVIPQHLNFICQHFRTLYLFHLHTHPPMKMGQSVPKRWHIKFRRQGITQKKVYDIQNTAEVWNQELLSTLHTNITQFHCPPIIMTCFPRIQVTNNQFSGSRTNTFNTVHNHQLVQSSSHPISLRSGSITTNSLVPEHCRYQACHWTCSSSTNIKYE
jgi:hypothetical protein